MTGGTTVTHMCEPEAGVQLGAAPSGAQVPGCAVGCVPSSALLWLKHPIKFLGELSVSGSQRVSGHKAVCTQAPLQGDGSAVSPGASLSDRALLRSPWARAVRVGRQGATSASRSASLAGPLRPS